GTTSPPSARGWPGWTLIERFTELRACTGLRGTGPSQAGVMPASVWDTTEETENASSRAAALASDFQGATHCALWITAKDFCRGLTAPSGGIRSASSIGTIVRSSAVVVGQRFERGVP